jgi:serine/threonine-protein kinase
MDFEQLGPYRIVRKLGQGGMGAVYEGVDDQGNKAAIKTLTPALASQRGFRARFEIEIETLRRLEHPNIVRIHGFGEQGDQLFYVMELVSGWSLEHVRHGRKQLPWRQVIDIGKQICKALKHAHDRGIVHRDIKPANIMITPSGQVKLSDFGIAQLWGLTGLTVEGGILGTATYMSPEQADGHKVTPRSDLYSVGCVLYALLAGRPPFRSNSVTEMLRLQRTAKPDPVTQYAPDVPPELELILVGLLEKDPIKRIATAAVLNKALQSVIDAVALRSGEATMAGAAPDSADDANAAPSDELRTLAGSLQAAAESPATPSPGESPTSDEATIASAAPAPRSTAPPSRPSPPPRPAEAAADETLVRTPAIPPPPLPPPAAHTHHTGPDGIATATLASGDVAPRRPVAQADPYQLDVQPPAESPRQTAMTGAGGETQRGTFITAEQAAERDRIIAMQQQRSRPTVIAISSIVLAAMLLIGVPITLWWMRPPSADQLYGFITDAFESGSAERMIDCELYVAQFQRLYADDPRADDVKQFGDEIELIKLERRLQFRSRHLGKTQTSSPLERAYLEAISYSRVEPEAGLKRLNALLILFGDDPTLKEDDKPYLELARRQATRMQQQINEYAGGQLMHMRQQMQRAGQLSQTDPAAAAAIYRSLLSLYADKAWAGAIIDQARAQLAALPADPPPPAADDTAKRP